MYFSANDGSGVQMALLTSGNVGIGTTSPSYKNQISVVDTTAYSASTISANQFQLAITNTGAAGVAGLLFVTEPSSGNGGHCGIRALSTGSGDSALTFSTRGSNTQTERMRIQANGNVMIGNSSHFTSNVAKLDVVHPGANTAPTYVSRFFQETNNQGTDHATIQLRHAAAVSGQTGVMVDFKNSAGNSHGSIKMGPSSVTFNTTSDYRMKENIASLTNGITRLKQLIPKRFNFINDTTKTVVDGFFAHEVSPVVPEAISGTKDKVDSDGNPEYQSIDQSKLVPLLVAALQEAIGRIEALEAG